MMINLCLNAGITRMVSAWRIKVINVESLKIMCNGDNNADIAK